MNNGQAIDCLFPLMLKEWKRSWVQATNSPGELQCQVEAAWGEGYENGDELIAAMDAAGVQTVLATDLLAWSYKRQTRFALDMTDKIHELTLKYPGRIYGLADYDPSRTPRVTTNAIYVDADEDGVWTPPGGKSCNYTLAPP